MPMVALLALTGAGVAMNAVGQIKAGHAQKAAGEAQQAAANSQADLADYNASVADAQAQDAESRGEIAASNFRRSVKGMIGAQRAGIAAGNIDVGFGSAVDVQADAARLGEMDVATIRTNAAREAWGYQVQATDLRASADIARKTGVYQAQAGEAAQSASYFGAAGTILTGASSLLSAKYGFGKK